MHSYLPHFWLFLHQNLAKTWLNKDKADFNHHLECAAPKHWKKYTTDILSRHTILHITSHPSFSRCQISKPNTTTTTKQHTVNPRCFSLTFTRLIHLFLHKKVHRLQRTMNNLNTYCKTKTLNLSK